MRPDEAVVQIAISKVSQAAGAGANAVRTLPHSSHDAPLPGIGQGVLFAMLLVRPQCEARGAGHAVAELSDSGAGACSCFIWGAKSGSEELPPFPQSRHQSAGKSCRARLLTKYRHQWTREAGSDQTIRAHDCIAGSASRPLPRPLLRHKAALAPVTTPLKTMLQLGVSEVHTHAPVHVQARRLCRG